MAREEEIERASVHHLNQYDYSYEEGEHLDLYIKGFTEGANWADEHPKNIWHDASEEPKEYPILCIDKLGNIWTEYSLYDYIEGWTENIEFNDISQWAYIRDLLPKQFGNSEQLKEGKNDRALNNITNVINMRNEKWK